MSISISSQKIDALLEGWPGNRTFSEAAADWQAVMSAMYTKTLDAYMTGGGKGPGPLPHRNQQLADFAGWVLQEIEP